MYHYYLSVLGNFCLSKLVSKLGRPGRVAHWLKVVA